VGTKRPSNWTAIGEQNPCPLNVCCNMWGNCGMTKDFCTAAPVPGGGPGSAKAGSNGCIGNCDDLVLRDKPVTGPGRHIGYFEAWNSERSCLNMDVTKMAEGVAPGAQSYTHIHYAFVDIAADWTLDTSKTKAQFDRFVAMTSPVKKIISMGGWAFSNDAGTYQRFRDVVASEGNRKKLARSIADHVTKYKLDGVDFDWEYAGVRPRCPFSRLALIYLTKAGHGRSWHPSWCGP
jgi:GH18 family chitinase